MAKENSRTRAEAEKKPLPDFYATVAQDIIAFCGAHGVAMDLGCGPGGVGLAVVERTPMFVVFVDPDKAALDTAVCHARNNGFARRTLGVVSPAECLPFTDACFDTVFSRGSFYFWKDRAAGLREVFRVLRSGGTAMIGGGLGSSYPQWARQEFIRRRRTATEKEGEQAAAQFREARSPQTFHQLALEAGLKNFEVCGEGGLSSEDPRTGLGIWLKVKKDNTNG